MQEISNLFFLLVFFVWGWDVARYIMWVKDAFPSGGTQSELLPLLEACTRTFQTDERYRSDLRYLRVWVQYVSTSSLESFCLPSFLHLLSLFFFRFTFDETSGPRRCKKSWKCSKRSSSNSILCLVVNFLPGEDPTIIHVFATAQL